MAEARDGERWHALDAVRGGALMLGIVFHATVSFLPSQIPVWIVMDGERSVALAVVFHVLHIFRMTTFFLIAGFFGRMMLHRKGTKGFAIDRLRRIGLPLVVFWPILFAAIVAVTIWGAMTMLGVPFDKLPPPPKATGLLPFPLTHLWFLWVLLLLYALALAVRGAVAAADGSGRLRATVDGLVRAVTGSPFAPVLLGAPVAALLAVQPNWPMWFGIPTPDASLIPNAPAFLGFAVAFGFGWLVNRQPELMRTWERRWPLNLAIALASTAGGLAITGLAPLMEYAKPDWRTWTYAALYGVAVWSWTLALIGLALRFLSGHSPARRYVADASYWLYLVHLPIVMALQVALAKAELPALVKFALILAVAFPVMFASYHLLVRRSWIGGWLNGRRAPRAAETRLPSAATPAAEPSP